MVGTLLFTGTGFGHLWGFLMLADISSEGCHGESESLRRGPGSVFSSPNAMGDVGPRSPLRCSLSLAEDRDAEVVCHLTSVLSWCLYVSGRAS